MKVLQILGDSAFGGGSYQVLALCKHLKANGFEVSLLSTDEFTINKFTDEGIDVISPAFIDATVSPLNDFKAVRILTRFLQENKFDIVHTHTSKAGFLGRLSANNADVPLIIYTVHGYAFDDGYGFPKKQLFKYLEKKAGKWSDLLITISSELFKVTKEDIVGVDKNVELIENGVDWQKFKMAAQSRDKVRRELGIDQKLLLVGMISRLSHPKIPQDLIRAASNLKKQQINAKYLIVGNGPLESDIDKLIKELELEDDIIRLGFREDIPEILSAIDVFVLPTLWEGRSMSILEAMAAGKAIITTDIPANRELLENEKEAFLVPVRNVDVLTTAISTLANNRELLSKMGKTVKAKVFENYTIDNSLKKTLAAYKKAINTVGLKD